MAIKIIGKIWLLLAIVFIVWLWWSYRAQNVEAFLVSNDEVTVSDDQNAIQFTPIKPYAKTLVFFPGALVDPRAYSPMCFRVAEHGYKAIIVKMPFRLAQFGYNQTAVIYLFSDTTKKYYLSGHSKGGAMAARFVYEKLARANGLILMGTTRPKDFDLSTLQIPVMKIYGDVDGVAKPEDVIANKNKLPANTRFIAITGGNHSQFGWYGNQFGDHKAGISRIKQQELILQYLLSMMINE